MNYYFDNGILIESEDVFSNLTPLTYEEYQEKSKEFEEMAAEKERADKIALLKQLQEELGGIE